MKPPPLTSLPEWRALRASALALDPTLDRVALRIVAGAPFAFGPLDRVDDVAVRDITRSIAAWRARTGQTKRAS